jgi:hypothetical protein
MKGPDGLLSPVSELMDGFVIHLFPKLCYRILQLQFSTLQIGDLRDVCIRMLSFRLDLRIQRPVLALQFCQVRFKGHKLTSSVKG